MAFELDLKIHRDFQADIQRKISKKRLTNSVERGIRAVLAFEGRGYNSAR